VPSMKQKRKQQVGRREEGQKLMDLFWRKRQSNIGGRMDCYLVYFDFENRIQFEETGRTIV
jgi:hypothetical protein